MVESPINLVGVQRELLDQIPIMRHTFPETGGGGLKMEHGTVVGDDFSSIRLSLTVRAKHLVT